jgi:hypothetical protein
MFVSIENSYESDETYIFKLTKYIFKSKGGSLYKKP